MGIMWWGLKWFLLIKIFLRMIINFLQIKTFVEFELKFFVEFFDILLQINVKIKWNFHFEMKKFIKSEYLNTFEGKLSVFTEIKDSHGDSTLLSWIQVYFLFH